MSLPLIPLGLLGKGELLTLSLVAATSGTWGLTVPAGVQSGDLLIFSQVASDFFGPPATDPAGFANLYDRINFGSGRKRFSGRVADGSESGSGLVGMAVDDARSHLLVFRGNRALETISSGFSPVQNATGGNPTPIVVTSGSGVRPVLVLAHYFTGDGGTVNQRTFTPGKDGEHGATNVWTAWKFYGGVSTPANVTIDMDDEGSNNWIDGFYLELG